MFDAIAHGNSSFIEIVNGDRIVKVKARIAAKIIKNKEGFKKSRSIRLFSCNTGSTKEGFAQDLANKLGKPVYAPNMKMYSDYKGRF